ncbi:hypothetical protein [Nocardia carnea]|uniref:hypothetical protein n=1 Tax=Nocardia carnea TaxID=37328 RepID=UPI002455777F|nr:hypothetical protein [Nocardia carnea]
MPTATVHVAKVDGYYGKARCFKLDPPRMLDGVAYEYVTVAISPRLKAQAAEVRVYPARQSGGCATPSMQRRVGSFTLDGHAIGDDQYEQGCWFLALQMLGGYVLEDPA